MRPKNFLACALALALFSLHIGIERSVFENTDNKYRQRQRTPCEFFVNRYPIRKNHTDSYSMSSGSEISITNPDGKKTYALILSELAAEISQYKELG